MTVLAAPRLMNMCLGHEAQERALLSRLNEGACPHALLFTGIKGIGKATFAHRWAQFLLAQGLQHTKAAGEENCGGLFGDECLTSSAENPPSTCTIDSSNPQVQLYKSGAHPDCKIVERGYDEAKGTHKASVEVRDIRAVTPFLHMKASYGGWRIVIIDDADTMNRNAQNALLKMLEEPPDNTLIILIAHRPGRLIPTIHSRVQRIPFHPLPDTIMQDLLGRTEHPPNKQISDQLIGMAHGSIGEAMALHEGGGAEILQTVFKQFSLYPKIDWPTLHKLADGLSKKGQDQEYSLFLKLFERVLQDGVIAKARSSGLPSYLSGQDGLTQMLDCKALPEIMRLRDAVSEHIHHALRSNLDKKQTILHAIGLIAA